MVKSIRYQGGIVREIWDDDTRTYTAWNSSGVQTTQRPYNTEENRMADSSTGQVYADSATREFEETQKALVESLKKLSEEAHSEGSAWVQPSGAHDAYAKGAKVTHSGKTWISLTPFNVWIPGVTGWREEVASGNPAWVQPEGAHDAYPLGAKVSYNGSNWESGYASNVWIPGVFGWTIIP